jgi:hypothetical protein
MLQRYNHLDKMSLAKGDSIAVPLIHIRMRNKSAPDPESKARRDEHHRLQTDAETTFPLARTSWLQGDFGGVKGMLSPFAAKLSYLDTQAAVDVGLLLGRAHIAFEETDQAVKLFAQVLERKPTHVLNVYSESPKVIDAWKQAGGSLR